MEKEFWLERWEKWEIGFHQNTVNPYLSRFWPGLNLADECEVFVPLCGKSSDLLWLRGLGHKVLGIELSDIAVQAFFRDNGYLPQRNAGERFTSYEADRISILCGDFFELDKDDLSQIESVYDRASLIALPPEMRKKYVRHLVNILPPAIQILLITLDYSQMEMPGPPFAVSSDEVQSLYRDFGEIRLLAQQDVLEQNPHFKARGLTGLKENVFLLSLF